MFVFYGVCVLLWLSTFFVPKFIYIIVDNELLFIIALCSSLFSLSQCLDRNRKLTSF